MQSCRMSRDHFSPEGCCKVGSGSATCVWVLIANRCRVWPVRLVTTTCTVTLPLEGGKVTWTFTLVGFTPATLEDAAMAASSRTKMKPILRISSPRTRVRGRKLVVKVQEGASLNKLHFRTVAIL